MFLLAPVSKDFSSTSTCLKKITTKKKKQKKKGKKIPILNLCLHSFICLACMHSIPIDHIYKYILVTIYKDSIVLWSL
uniref:Uncharacterized protein n=1 Tax=Octopus bimaculoides TaxID=37653 RepID=A0A0L8HVB7_OCTBM